MKKTLRISVKGKLYNNSSILWKKRKKRPYYKCKHKTIFKALIFLELFWLKDLFKIQLYIYFIQLNQKIKIQFR